MESINAWTSLWAQSKSISNFYLPSVESTNSWAKLDFKPQLQNAVFLADHQTHGRGRGSHQWLNTEPGTACLSTWCFTIPSIPHPLLNMRIGFALFESASLTWPALAFALKAPNDLYLLDGKFAGILTEVVTGGTTAIYIGIGMNVFAKPYLNEQKTQALADHTALRKQDWFTFCDHLFTRFTSLSQDSSRAHLTNSEQDKILRALKKYIGNAIQTIEPDGSLQLTNGRICHWNEL